MRAQLVIVSAPSLQLFPCVGKRQEPMRVQALRPQAAVEGFDEGVVRRLAGPRKVQRDVVCIRPEVQIAGDELRSLIDPDGLRSANSRARLLKRRNDVL